MERKETLCASAMGGMERDAASVRARASHLLREIADFRRRAEPGWVILQSTALGGPPTFDPRSPYPDLLRAALPCPDPQNFPASIEEQRIAQHAAAVVMARMRVGPGEVVRDAIDAHEGRGESRLWREQHVVYPTAEAGVLYHFLGQTTRARDGITTREHHVYLSGISIAIDLNHLKAQLTEAAVKEHNISQYPNERL